MKQIHYSQTGIVELEDGSLYPLFSDKLVFEAGEVSHLSGKDVKGIYTCTAVPTKTEMSGIIGRFVSRGLSRVDMDFIRSGIHCYTTESTKILSTYS